jgi:hypothetical protein
MEKPKRPRGRPPKDPSERLELRAMRLSPAQWAKIELAGIDELRKQIDKWKPTPKE